MQIVLNVALPVFAMILAGFAGGRAGLLGPSASQALNQFVYWFALPAVLFLGTARQPLSEILNLHFIGAFLGAMLAVYVLGGVLGRLLRRDRPAVHAMQALNACFSNTGYMGIPLFLAAFGPERLLPAIIATVIMSAVMVGLAVVSLELAGAVKGGLRRALADMARALVKNPLIIASAAGILWSAAALPMPTPLANLLQLMGAAAGPCALFAIGVFLASRSLRFDWHEVGWMVPLKLLVQPALTWLLIATLFPLDEFWTAATLLLAALPTGALTFVVASQYGVYVERTSQVILISTVASLPILSALLVALAPAG